MIDVLTYLGALMVQRLCGAILFEQYESSLSINGQQYSGPTTLLVNKRAKHLVYALNDAY